MQNKQHILTYLHTAARLDDVLATLDAVHTAASENRLDTLNTRGAAELAGWLREIAYIAEETANEIEREASTAEDGDMPSPPAEGAACALIPLANYERAKG